MAPFDRRAFLLTAGAAAVLAPSQAALAQTACVTNGMPFLPTYLTVDCASRQNFKLFRANSDYLGLAAAVSMTAVRGKYGSYQAGNLFLFPWLKPKGQALAGRAWSSVLPTNATGVTAAAPIPDATLPLDEYLCRVRLAVPYTSCIGCTVDVPYSASDAKLGWFSNTDKLADGSVLGIDWTSSNMNNNWFGGSRWIPATDTCNGASWRKLIANGLQLASSGAC
jgi:hypothetical protein